MTANLEERQFFRIKTPATHAEVMTYLSAFAAVESFIVILVSGGCMEASSCACMHAGFANDCLAKPAKTFEDIILCPSGGCFSQSDYTLPLAFQYTGMLLAIKLKDIVL